MKKLNPISWHCSQNLTPVIANIRLIKGTWRFSFMKDSKFHILVARFMPQSTRTLTTNVEDLVSWNSFLKWAACLHSSRHLSYMRALSLKIAVFAFQPAPKAAIVTVTHFSHTVWLPLVLLSTHNQIKIRVIGSRGKHENLKSVQLRFGEGGAPCWAIFRH